LHDTVGTLQCKLSKSSNFQDASLKLTPKIAPVHKERQVPQMNAQLLGTMLPSQAGSPELAA